MSDMNVNMGGLMQAVPCVDSEWKQILLRLLAYGYRSSRGSKSADKALLRSIEIKKAKLENSVSSKFLTVTKQEQEKIQENKKEKRIESNPKAYPDSQKGQKILGEQLYLAIKMNQEKKKQDNKKKSK